jgi:hypothetical protein
MRKRKMSTKRVVEVTPEMVEAAAAKVAPHLRSWDVASPSLCAEIAEDALRAGLDVMLKDGSKI